jgi:SAM-dependent methyltransferase
VDAVDVSAGMLLIAERTRSALPVAERDRIRLHQAPADQLAMDDASVDLVLTAFVLQLVPSPFRALREARRVLRPGGRLAHVNWLRSEVPFAADEAFDAALIEVGLPARDPGGRRNEPSSPGEVEARLRRAGFTRARARRDVLVHQFTPEGFLEFLARFDAEDLFSSLDVARRDRLRDAALRRLRALPADQLRLELPIAYATAHRSRHAG